jgi:probable HAF family extracellular repeat protein
MKINVIIKTMVVILFTALLSVGNMFGQTNTSRLTTAQSVARQAQLSQNMLMIIPPTPSTATPTKIHPNKATLAKASPMGKPSPMNGPQTPTSQSYPYQVIDVATNGQAEGINNSGQVVGYYGPVHAFIYTSGVIHDLAPSGSFSIAYGINSLGQVVGELSTSDGLHIHAFLYTGGSMQDLGTINGLGSSIAYGINNLGQVVGSASADNSLDQHAFLYTTNGVMQDLGTLGGDQSYAQAINDSGNIVGNAYKSNGREDAFLYSGGVMQDLVTLTGIGMYATGINANNQITGDAGNAFLYFNGSVQNLGTLPGGSYSQGKGINASGQVVGTADNSDGYKTAFLYSGGVMQDLNTLIDPNSGWTLYGAVAVNDVGQIVGSGYNSNDGQVDAFILTPSWLQAINTPFVPQPYGTYPGRQHGKDNLVLITHGFIPPWQTAEASTAWVDSMSNSIATYLSAHNLTNWQVVGYKWIGNAESIEPQQALMNGTMDGGNLGKAIGSEGWTNVHLIAHSAGATLIQACSQTIKSNSPNTVVQCTFLDAFVGFDYAGVTTYGKGANWSDSYFSKDLLTGGEDFPFTEGPLSNAFNVDVTYLDTSKKTYDSYISSSGTIVQCQETKSSHEWPTTFYAYTVSGLLPANGLGFPVSKEGGILGSYTEGNTPEILGTPDSPCSVNTGSYVSTPPYIGPALNYSTMPIQQSGTNIIEASGLKFTQTADDPAWLEAAVTVSNQVNLVSFDAQFLSTNAQGIASVYWNANTLGFLDESVVQPGLQHYTMSFPTAASNSVHMLGFRLDPSTNGLSSTISVTNVVLGYSGVRQPFTLSYTGDAFAGFPVLRLTGQSGFNYTVQASTDLTSTNWTDISVLVNTNGAVQFIDPDSVNYGTRFYRVVVPQ